MRTNLVTVAVFFTDLLVATSAQAQGSIEGTWQMYEVTVSRGANFRTAINPNLGLLMFTERHYGMFVNAGDRPDVPPGSGPLATDELKLAAFESFIANAGTYEVSGSKLTLHLMLARSPSGLGSSPEFGYRIDGDKLITTTTSSAGVETRTTYARLD